MFYVIVSDWWKKVAIRRGEVNMILPDAVSPEKVGSYPVLTKSGGGYFYDEVLEYRVWLHLQDNGSGDDCYHAFSTFEEAVKYSQSHKGAEEPLVLVLQKEFIDEVQPGKYKHIKKERITEWSPEWLPTSKRNRNSISDFLRNQKQPEQKNDGT
jgi:hypothetical protein